MPGELMVNFLDGFTARLEDADAPGYWGFRWERSKTTPNVFHVFQYAGISGAPMSDAKMVDACRLLVPSVRIERPSVSRFDGPRVWISDVDHVHLRLMAEPWD